MPTQWFPEYVRPVRPGWYDTIVYNLNGSVQVPLLRKYWCGERWRHTEGSDFNICGMQCREWRGQTKREHERAAMDRSALGREG
jgi:hypothetical protein